MKAQAVFLAQKEGFEPSRAFYTPTPLAGEPLRPLGYFCMPNILCTIKLPNHISTARCRCQEKRLIYAVDMYGFGE